MKSYLVNGHEIKIKKSIFSGTLSIEEYEKQIINALFKIGVSQKYIQIKRLNEGVKVTWEINKKEFSFICNSQEELKLNMGAIAQAIQEDVRQITRGIKDLDLVMKQYQNEDISEIKKPKNLVDFHKEDEINIFEENDEEIEIFSKADARLIISNIKSRYKNFTDLSLIPEKEKEKLRKAYIFLGVEVKF